ncbi:MAG: hypothetical protein HOU81_06455 [Hamadaea sp.]|uniref:hypothetical protein n=1 Tax=Hamadaea sp. TaxID=2024425 RepID=UPI0017AF7461|nr:hypothetical protein [Hamadaea sp.]NUR70441.1 hypothetical protein [Hamadaea sp.]NUT20031.1 hypothetical protein [Hamadaea sp.]
MVATVLVGAVTNLLTGLAKAEWVGRFLVPLIVGGALAVAFLVFAGIRDGHRAATGADSLRFTTAATGNPGNGVMYLMAVSQTGGLLMSTYQEPGRWSTWQDLRPPTRPRDVAASVPQIDRLEVSYVDDIGQVWTTNLTPTDETPKWTRLPTATTVGRAIKLSALSNGLGHGEIFIVGEYGGVAHIWHGRGGMWAAEWGKMKPPGPGRDIAASVPVNGLMEIFVVAAGERILNRWYRNDPEWWRTWGEGYGHGLPHSCVAIDVLNGWPNHHEIFVVRSDGGISHRDHWQGADPKPWRDLDAPVEMADVTAGITSDGHLEVVAISRAGELWQRSYSDASNWTEWRSLEIGRAAVSAYAQR